MTTYKASKIADGLIFGEGLRWDSGKLILSDMLGKRVVQVCPDSGQIDTLLEVAAQPNGIIVREPGCYLIASMFDATILEYRHGAVSVFADLSAHVSGYLGDMVSDVHGNVFVDDVGARVLHGEEPRLGRVICVRADGTIEIARDQVAFPNGIVISADGEKLYLAETMTAKIWEHTLNERGVLGDAREVIDLSGFSRIDGMSMDAEGGLWACMLDQDVVLRITADGEKTDQVKIAGCEPIAATIGGVDQQTLFITAIEALGGKNIFEEMTAGRVKASLWQAQIPFNKGQARP